MQSTQQTAHEDEQRTATAPAPTWVEIPGFGRIDALGEAQAVRVDAEPEDDQSEHVPEPGGPADQDGPGRRPGPGPFVPSSSPASSPVPATPRDRPAGITATPRGPVLESRTKDWYCTNRPSIGVGFQLPPGLVRGDLPKPGTPEFDAMVAELLALLRARGVDTSALERFQESLLARARGLESPGDMPGFLESLGFDWFTEAPDEAGRKRWRDLMELRTQAWWLRLLATGDPALIREGLRRRGKAFGLFDGAMQESTQAAIIATQANQRLTEDVLNALPYVGEANDILALYRGETLSGQKLTAFGAVLTTAGLLAPFGLEQLFKRSAKARRLLSRLGEMGEGMTDAAKRKLATALGKSFDDVDIALRKVTDFMTKERSLLRRTNSETADAARRAFVNTTEGAADLRRMRQAERNAASIVEDLDVLSQSRRQAQQQLDALRRTGADPAALRRVEQQVADLDDLFVRRATDLQGDKLAQRVVNSDAARDALRRDVNDTWKRVYSDVDDAVGRRLKDTDVVRDIARRRGADMDDVIVKPLSITNKRPSTGGTPRTSVGRDRDITYVVERIRRGADGAPLRGPKGEILSDYLGDVPHGPRGITGQTDEMLEGAKGVYMQEFWRKTRGEPVPDLTSDLGRRQLQDWGAHLDQMVTSKFHREAYAVGEVKLDAFLDKGLRPTLTRPQDIADTFRVKSDHWFHAADKAQSKARSLRNAGNVAAAEVALVRASQHTAEGMRQATKQYKDLILSRARQYGLRPDVHVPARLQSAMEIFDDVGKGIRTPRQAEEMLRALSPRGPGGKVLYELNPRRIVDELSGFIEGMEQSAGKAYRTIRTAKVLEDLPRAIGGKGPKEALERITSELNAGNISGETFNQLEGYLNRSLVNGHVDGDTFMALRQGLMDRTREAARRVTDARNASSTLSSWAGQAYQRRLISVAERQTLAEPVGN